MLSTDSAPPRPKYSGETLCDRYPEFPSSTFIYVVPAALTFTDGIFIAGACQGPKDIPDTVAQASGVAGRVLRTIVSGSTPGSRLELGLEDIERQAAALAQP